jgi:Calx-beta domain-containing protein
MILSPSPLDGALWRAHASKFVPSPLSQIPYIEVEALMKSLHKVILIGSLMLVASLEAAASDGSPLVGVPQTLLYMNSQPGDWVGGGQQYTFTPADGSFIVQGTYNNGIQISFNTADFSQWWYLDFGPPSALKFVKSEYVGAQRFAFHSPARPGMDVFGDGRGCNTDAGQFLVSELVFNPDGTVARLAIDFEQHCDGDPPALYGSVRYNSAISLVPRFGVGNAAALKGNAGTSDSSVLLALSMPSSAPVSVQYATQDGSAIQGIDYVATTGSVTLPPGVTTQTITIPIIGDRKVRGSKIFKVLLNNPSGAPLGDRSASVKTLDPNGSLTVLSMYGQPGDYISPGQLLLTTADGVFTPTRNYDQGVSIDLNDGDFWELDFAAPNNVPLGKGDYENAQRFPFQAPGVPGLSVWGAGRGCNTLTGSFIVSKAAYDLSGNVQHFSADFEQHCDGGAPALRGSVRVKAPLRQISVSSATIVNGSAGFTVTLNPASNDTVSVNFATADGTAIGGVDYLPLSQTVVFAPGQTAQTVTVQILKSGTGKKFYGELSVPTGAPLWINQGSATIQ